MFSFNNLTQWSHLGKSLSEGLPNWVGLGASTRNCFNYVNWCGRTQPSVALFPGTGFLNSETRAIKHRKRKQVHSVIPATLSSCLDSPTVMDCNYNCGLSPRRCFLSGYFILSSSSSNRARVPVNLLMWEILFKPIGLWEFFCYIALAGLYSYAGRQKMR